MPGMQGGPLEHTIAAKATCFRIAMTDAFREYQTQIRRNADALAESLLEGGLSLITGGTDTHLLLVDLRDSEWTGKAAEERLDEISVTVNRNTVPFDERSPFVTSGIRLGSPAMTMRGLDEDDFSEVGRIICEALTESPDLDGLRSRVAALIAKRPLYEGFRGYTTYVA
jgi:glycine hydroxymethyltransferase